MCVLTCSAFSLSTDYVCVLDIDLLELAITTWKGSDAGKLVRECLYSRVVPCFTHSG